MIVLARLDPVDAWDGRAKCLRMVIPKGQTFDAAEKQHEDEAEAEDHECFVDHGLRFTSMSLRPGRRRRPLRCTRLGSVPPDRAQRFGGGGLDLNARRLTAPRAIDPPQSGHADERCAVHLEGVPLNRRAPVWFAACEGGPSDQRPNNEAMADDAAL